MEIDCPKHAIALWLEGDQFAIRFPDNQLVHIPATEPGRLINVLRTRAQFAMRGEPMTIATIAAPLQHDFDRRIEDLSRADYEARKLAQKERDTKRQAKKMAAIRRQREADEILQIVGLI